MVFQTTYSATQPAGLPGQLVNGEEFNAFSRTVETSGGIGFGVPVFRGAADRGCIKARTLAASGAADAGNAGAGTITASPTVAQPAVPGNYKVVHTSAGATAAFDVFDPDGNFVGNGATGTPFSAGGLTFTVTDAGTDPAIGDSYTITVTGEEFLGVTRRNPATNGTDGDLYAQYREAAVVDMGVIWVSAEEAVADGGQAYFNPSTNKWSADSANDVRIPNARYDATLAAAGIVPLRVRRVP